jgi:hypothetical protein
VGGLYYPLLHGLWPTITPQDNLPLFPILYLAVCPGVIWLGEWLAARCRSAAGLVALPLLLIGAESAWLLVDHPLFARPNTKRTEKIAQALRLTDRGEYVLDPKGDLIFRPRAFYYAYETFTRRRIDLGLIINDSPRRLVQTRTAVVDESARLGKEPLTFIHQNYLPVGGLDVLGKALPEPVSGRVAFAVEIPERYAVTSPYGPVSGMLDGAPLLPAQWLSPGPHELRLSAPVAELSLIWARALERGFPAPHWVPPTAPTSWSPR